MSMHDIIILFQSGISWEHIIQFALIAIIIALYLNRDSIHPMDLLRFKQRRQRHLKKMVYALEDHPLMTELAQWRDYRIGRIVFTSETRFSYLQKQKRLWCAKKFLDCKISLFLTGFTKIKDNVLDAHDNNDRQTLAKYMTESYWNDIIMQAVKDYSKQAEDCGVCPIFVDTFNHHHNIAVEFAIEKIAKTLRHAPYTHPLEFLYAIFDVVYFAFHVTFVDMGIVLMLNGELEHELNVWDLPDNRFGTERRVDHIEVQTEKRR